jgi:hypothetical protein
VNRRKRFETRLCEQVALKQSHGLVRKPFILCTCFDTFCNHVYPKIAAGLVDSADDSLTGP